MVPNEWILHVILLACLDQNTGWQQFAPLPDPIGYAGMAAGVSHDSLMIMGGARFPNQPPWKGGIKEYSTTIWTLNQPEGLWHKDINQLPQPIAYAVSGTWNNTIIVAGGESRARPINPVQTQSKVQAISFNNRGSIITDLPPLPSPVSHASGSFLGSRLFVIGGIDSPEATSALKQVFVLDMNQRIPTWKTCPPWPGPARMLAVTATIGTQLYVFGGVELYPDSGGLPLRRYLRDAYRRDSDGTWQRLADLPHPIAATANPAPTTKDRIWVIGGDDGSNSKGDPATHLGFRTTSLAYEILNNRWLVGPKVAAPRVTLPAVQWRDRWWLVSGEMKPGIRSPEIWTVAPRFWEHP